MCSISRILPSSEIKFAISASDGPATCSINELMLLTEGFVLGSSAVSVVLGTGRRKSATSPRTESRMPVSISATRLSSVSEIFSDRIEFIGCSLLTYQSSADAPPHDIELRYQRRGYWPR